MFYSVWSHSLPVCGIVPLWLELDVLVIGMKKSLSVDIHGTPPAPPFFFFLFLTLSKVRLIYISQTCSFLLRNGFS